MFRLKKIIKINNGQEKVGHIFGHGQNSLMRDLKHPIAVLRRLLGFNQQEFAQLVQRSRSTIKAVELGHLALSQKLADHIAAMTGVDAGWLTEGDPHAPIRKFGGDGNYNLQDYEHWTAVRTTIEKGDPYSAKEADERAIAEGMKIGEMLAKILRAAMESSPTDHAVAIHRIANLILRLQKDFGIAAIAPADEPWKLIQSVEAAMRPNPATSTFPVVDSVTFSVKESGVPFSKGDSGGQKK
ncbi:MAG: XRE family transcriptional regulator [Verrucomicrobiaceae bacterium]|nr:MAG: XRE family transcriptional regulator [Verrucomicrobiaceae bacterium]